MPSRRLPTRVPSELHFGFLRSSRSGAAEVGIRCSLGPGGARPAPEGPVSAEAQRVAAAPGGPEQEGFPFLRRLLPRPPEARHPGIRIQGASFPTGRIIAWSFSKDSEEDSCASTAKEQRSAAKVAFIMLASHRVRGCSDSGSGRSIDACWWPRNREISRRELIPKVRDKRVGAPMGGEPPMAMRKCK